MSDNLSPYYQHSGKVPIASRISYRVRRQTFNLFMETMKPSSISKVLDIGVTSDSSYRESNFFEKFYPYKSQIACVGTENGAYLEIDYPGLRFIQVEPGKPLPFSDKEFDIVFSNAVIEHVGNTEDQTRFIREACRVAERVFISTPNRWFPIEHHSSLPLFHYLPKPLYRKILYFTPLRYWSYEQNLNILTLSEFTALFPPNYSIAAKRFGIGSGLLRSNLVAYSV
jgi:SAM-dependent methyltransferase